MSASPGMQFLMMSCLFVKNCSYNVEVDAIATILGATVQWAVVSSDSVPGSVEVIGHHIDKVQIPTGTP